MSNQDYRSMNEGVAQQPQPAYSQQQQAAPAYAPQSQQVYVQPATNPYQPVIKNIYCTYKKK